MQSITKIAKRGWPYILGAVLGGIIGYLYWYYIGCVGGACPLKATPMPSIVLGVAVGIYVGVLLNRRKG